MCEAYFCTFSDAMEEGLQTTDLRCELLMGDNVAIENYLRLLGELKPLMTAIILQ